MRTTFNISKRFFSYSRINSQINLSFFTKDNCMLCSNARHILHDTLKLPELAETKINLETIDIMDPKNKEWFEEYCYDVPVLLVNRPNQPKPTEFMHYFYKDKLLEEFSKK
ncbi:hypothetical protein SBY92_000292 [Candida maltosa Xu316]